MSKELEALEYLKPFRWEDKKTIEAYDISKKALIELDDYKKIAKSLIYLVDELNLSKCGENSKVRKKIREFKILLGEIKWLKN